MGAGAETYLQAVETALTKAAAAHSANPFGPASDQAVPLPALGIRANQDTPHPPDTAHSGGSSSGTGSSDNIVVDHDGYCEFLKKVSRSESKIASAIYNIASGIDELCKNAFDVPQTTQEVRIIALGVKNALEEFGELTYDADTRMRSFIGKMLDIG